MFIGLLFCVKAKSCGTSDVMRRSSAGIRTITSEFVTGDPFCVINLLQGDALQV